MGKISCPEPINNSHLLETFVSGEDSLDDWLKRRAINNDKNGASRTFVIQIDKNIIGYYSLATGSVISQKAPGKIKRNMPNPIPVMILARLAVHKDYQKKGIGKGLLKDAVLRTIKVSQDAGIKALLTHCLSNNAKHFYKRFGFIESPLDPMTLMLPLKDGVIS